MERPTILDAHRAGLAEAVNHFFPSSTIEDTHLPEHKMIIHSSTKKRTLLYVKPITGEPAFFNMSISDKAFGPELIHENDFRRLQLLMRDFEVSRCMYVLHSVNKGSFAYQFTFPLDMHYLEWIADG